jgi:anti-sigma B factor antagonist
MLTTAQRNDVVIAIAGDLDAATVTDARKRLLATTLGPGDRLVLDFSELGFTDSTGIRLILLTRDHALRHAAGFALAQVPDQLARMLALVGLDNQLETVTNGEA